MWVKWPTTFKSKRKFHTLWFLTSTTTFYTLCFLNMLWDPPITNGLSPFVSLLKRITPSFTILSRNTTLISRSTINLCFVMWLTPPWPFFNEINFFSLEENNNQNQHDQLQFTPNKGFHIISYNFILWWHTKDIWCVPHIGICTWEVTIKSRPTTLIDHVVLKFSLA